jgi:RecB family exonuclease
VIGGRDRWERRLDGLASTLDLDDREHESTARARADLAALRAYALPLIDELAALPHQAAWGTWIDVLAALATRALRRPERVLAVLAALAPMADVGPVDLREVQIVLHPQLAELIVPPPKRRHGSLFVGPIEAARGRAFDVVFVPGLAERMFPHKIVEDPLLLDAARAEVDRDLETSVDRLADERLALRLAVGAARTRAVLSYPRLDVDQGRPRVPSFYGLEVLEAAEGVLPGFDELGQRAKDVAGARIGWPAPTDRGDALDDAEHDLALLHDVFAAGAPRGGANYLLGANPHLGRALRFRARRWTIPAWKPADGLIVESEAARAVLAAHAPVARSFSPTALEQLAACPYRFALRTILRLEPREAPAAIEELGPLERGSLVHEVQFELLCELRDTGLLPIADLHDARDRLDAVLDRVAAKYRDDLCPAIDRVWSDGVASIRADLREWLRRLAAEASGPSRSGPHPWVPWRFELAFGLERNRDGRDPASVDEPVELAGGLRLRGSIDLVERDAAGALRATDHKTGKARVDAGAVIAGGASLQPVLYALALEKLVPGAEVSGGRLHYCTTRGNFTAVSVPLDAEARDAAGVLVATLAYHAANNFYPAAPAKDACTYCDYRAVCGPNEPARLLRKDGAALAQLARLRETR